MRTEKNAGIFQLSNQRYGKLWKKSIRNIVPTGAETGQYYNPKTGQPMEEPYLFQIWKTVYR